MGYRVTLEWELPEPLLRAVVKDQARVAEEVKLAAILDWVRMKKISSRKGAELLGVAYRDFLALMAEHKVPTLDYGEGWLEKELSAFEETKPERGL